MMRAVASTADTDTFQQTGFGSAIQTIAGALNVTITPENFGAVGDGVTDDIASFQNALNRIYALGGGTLLLTKPKYFLNQYTTAQVNGNAGENTLTGPSSVLFLPSNIIVRSIGMTELSFLANATTPFASLGLANSGIISAPINFESGETAVSSVNMTASSCVVASNSGLSVGQTVRLCRQGGQTGGINNTPSLEDAPLQFLTIASITGSGPYTIAFNESFIHRFDSTQNLFIKYRTGGKDYPRNVFLENLKITYANGSTSSHVYNLISRTINTGLRNVEFGPAVSGSIASTQRTLIDNMKVTLSSTHGGLTIENVSEVDIGTYTVEANGVNIASGLGGIFFSDNCKSVRIKKFVGRNCPSTVLAAFYGIEAEIDQIDLTNCGTASAPTGNTYSAAISLGFPAAGAQPSLAAAESNTFLCQNVQNSKIVINKFKSVGPSQVPIRLHDCDFRMVEADIEFSNPGGSASIIIGQSGNRRMDATYFPSGGQTRCQIGKLNVRTLSGSPATIIDTNGLGGCFREGTATITVAASSGATTVTVDDPTQFRISSVLYFVDELNQGSTGVNAAAYTVSSIAGNVLTLSAALTQNVAINTRCWSNQPNRNLAKVIKCDQVVLDGVVVNVGQGDAVYAPDFQTGAGPYITTQTFTIPSEGDWTITASIISTNYAHSVTAEYNATYSSLNAAQANIAQKWASTIGTNVAINSVSQTTNVITFTFQSSTQGKTARVSIRATPYRHIFGPEA